jgi:hypothetical protein
LQTRGSATGKCNWCGGQFKRGSGGLSKHTKSCRRKQAHTLALSDEMRSNLLRAATEYEDVDTTYQPDTRDGSVASNSPPGVSAGIPFSSAYFASDMELDDHTTAQVLANESTDATITATADNDIQENFDDFTEEWIDVQEEIPTSVQHVQDQFQASSGHKPESLSKLHSLQPIWSKLNVTTFEEASGVPAGTPLTPNVPVDLTYISSYAPFDDAADYAMALWFYKTKLTMENLTEFFSNPLLSKQREGLSYKTAAQWDQKMHMIPYGIIDDKFHKATISTAGLVAGMPRRKYTIRYRNALSVVRFLLGFPAFRDEMTYAPVHLHTPEGNRVYSELHTADWWWETQQKLPPNATVVPIMLSSDKTMLSQHRGDVSVWPVYLTIGNLSSTARRKQTVPGAILLGLIPVTKAINQSPELKAEIYHRSMDLMLNCRLLTSMKLQSKTKKLTLNFNSIEGSW